jgi:integrase
MLYRLVLATGLRRDEVASLTPESFHLSGGMQHVLVSASMTKNGKIAMQPLPSALVADLRPYLARQRLGVSVWPIKGGLTSKMLKLDLADAGIEAEQGGQTIDFRALRTTFGTQLARKGVPLVMGMRLMRHSDPKLTAVTYAVASLADLAAEIEKL